MQASLAARPTALRPARVAAPRRAASVVVRAAPVRGCWGEKRVPWGRSGGGGKLKSKFEDRRRKPSEIFPAPESVANDQSGRLASASLLPAFLLHSPASLVQLVSHLKHTDRVVLREKAQRSRKSDSKSEGKKITKRKQSACLLAFGRRSLSSLDLLFFPLTFLFSHLSLLSSPSTTTNPEQTAEDVRVALEKAAKLESSKAPKSDIKAAWDEVSSLSASAAGAVFQLSDGELAARSVAADKILEDYCSANPDADECRVYDD